jgi:SNF2 family DNA or RNA helicase
MYVPCSLIYINTNTLQMGLGKTVQSIAMVINHPNPRYPIGGTFSGLSPDSKKAALKIPEDIGRGTLVVAPLALIRQWEKEIDDKLESTHKLRVRVHHGPNRAKNAKDLRKYDVVITTYDIIRSEHGQSSFAEGGHTVGCFGIRWWRIICDEAHSIKNRLAKSSLAACALQARFRWCLTGTPIQNNLDELQSLIKFLRIPPYDDLPTWKEQITRPMQQNKGNIAIERLKVILGAIMLRRTKDVLKKDAEGKTGNQIKLPERNMDKVTAPFNGKEKIFYTKLEERTEENLEKMMAGFGEFGGTLSGKNMTSALVLLLRLRQACNHPHLLAGKIHKDKDSGLGLATPRKSKAAAKPTDDDDDLANLMGGLSVDQQQCDVCLSPLTQTEKEAGAVRCGECDENIQGVRKVQDRSKKHRKHRKPNKHYKGGRPTITSSDDEDGEPAKVKRRGRLAVLDSDDEDDAGSQAEHETDTESQAEESSYEEDDSDSDYDEDPYSQLLESTKIVRLLEILKKELKSKKKTIVFSQFTSMLDLIEPFLRRDGIAYARYDGSMKNDERERSLRRLRGDEEFAPRRGKGGEDRNWCGVLLCSLKCGALGLNLTCASRVVILEPFWNPVFVYSPNS